MTGSKVDNMSHALKVGQGAISNSVVGLPTEFDKATGKELWSFDILKDDQRGEMFIDILNYMDSRKLRGLFIPDKMGLASDGSPHSAGGASAGDTLDVFLMTEQALAGDVENVFDTQIISDLLRFNFNVDEIEPACIKLEKLDYNRKLLMKDIFLRMIMLVGSGIRDGRNPKNLPSIHKIAEMLDLPMESFDDIFSQQQILPVDSLVPNDSNGNVQKDLTPSLERKTQQDSANKNRGTQRKERSTKERSVKEKR